MRLTDSKAVANLSKRAGPVDVVVNNAGNMCCGPLLETSEDSISRLIIAIVT
jgi:NADP-dependent 3-hydroxy acid dehydrogenase YdfG